MKKEFELDYQLSQEPTRISATELVANKIDIMDQIICQNKIFILQRYGRDVVAVIPLEALNRLRETAHSETTPPTHESEQILLL